MRASVLDPKLFLPMPEAGYQQQSRDIVDPNGFDADLVPEKRNATGDDGNTFGDVPAIPPGLLHHLRRIELLPS